MEKVLCSWSSGKDSALSLYEIQQSGKYEVVSLLTTVSEGYDRVSMHGVPRTLMEQQARSLGLPVEEVFVPQSCSFEEYESIMTKVLTRFREEGITSIVFGDIFLEWVKKYRDGNLEKLGMKGIFPLWGRDTGEIVESFMALGFEAVITCVDTKTLDRRFVGRKFDRQLLAELPPGVNCCGENGEFHSFVFDGPIFQERINYSLGETVDRDSYCFRDLLPEVKVKSGT